MLTCAFKNSCSVGHMYRKDSLRTCDENGDCEDHKTALKMHPETKNARLFKCDASGKCDEPVMS